MVAALEKTKNKTKQKNLKAKVILKTLLAFSFFFFGGGLFRATLAAYVGSQTMGQIRAAAASLRHI